MNDAIYLIGMYVLMLMAAVMFECCLPAAPAPPATRMEDGAETGRGVSGRQHMRDDLDTRGKSGGAARAAARGRARGGAFRRFRVRFRRVRGVLIDDVHSHSIQKGSLG